jgi:hypothetical protein
MQALGGIYIRKQPPFGGRFSVLFVGVKEREPTFFSSILFLLKI